MSEEKSRVIALLSDEFMESKGVKSKIAGEGYRVEAFDGYTTETIEKLAELKPNIIVTDCDTVKLADRMHFLRALKEDARLKDSEVFFYTEDIDVRTEIEIRKLKISSYFMKSADPQHLLDAIAQHFDHGAEQVDYEKWKSEVDNIEIAEDNAAETSNYTNDEYSGEAPSGFEDTDEFGEMLETFHKGIEEKIGGGEQSFETYYNLGISYLEMGLFEQALGEFEKVKVSPDWNMKAVTMIGATQRKMGDYDKAIETYKAAFKETQDQFAKMSFLYEIADVAESQGKLPDAYRMFASIYQQNKEFKDVRPRLITLKNQIESRNKE